VLPNGAIQEILSQAMEKQFSIARPATRHFFEHEAPTDQQLNTVTIHQWVCATVRETDSRSVIVHLANVAVKEVVAAAAKVTNEVIFGVPNLLPYQPLWDDGSPLFATHAKTGGDSRFGLRGGNLLTSSGCLSDDVATASRRLSEMDTEFKGDERLQLFCAKPLEKTLIRACAKAKVPCRVFGVYNHKECRSWVITRDRSACSLLIGKSRLNIPVEGNKIVVAARLVVWINNPRLAVHMRAVT
jgi:hypothetical protein